MIYLYRALDGSEIEVERSMHDAPPIGHKIVRNHKTYRRVPSKPRIDMHGGGALRSQPVQGFGLPLVSTLSAEEREGIDGVDRWGQPCFDSGERARKWCDEGRKRAEKRGGGAHYGYQKEGPDGVEICAAEGTGRSIRAE